MSTETAPKGPIQIHYRTGHFVVAPEDQDRFVAASQQAVSACQKAVVEDRVTKLFADEFLLPLHKWCTEHRLLVEQCYVPFEKYGDCIKVFLVSRASKFDFDLSDAISDFERSSSRRVGRATSCS